MRRHQIGINCLQAHLVLERAGNKFAYRYSAPVLKERAHAQIGIDPSDLRGVNSTVGIRDNRAVVDALAG